MAAAPRARAMRRNDHGNMAPCEPSGRVRSRPLDDANAGRTGQYDGLREPDKETVLDHAREWPTSVRPAIWDRRSGRSEASSIQWPPSVTKAWPSLPCRSTVGPAQPAAAAAASTARRVAASPNGMTSIGSGKRPSVFDPFALVGDHHHAGRGRRHDLFPQQRAAAALDQGEVGADLVGAVDGHVELGRLVERGQRHAEPLGIGAGRLRGRHADDVEPAAHPLGQKLDEMPGGRAGAEPKPHARPHPFDRDARRLDVSALRCP